jgi:DNA polymerase-3 subunit epsilon
VSWFRKTPLGAARWVVVDCETSGLDPARDRLLSLGAVAVRGGAIELAESFAAVLRQDEPSAAENILVHGLGGDAQRGGVAAADALHAFSSYLGDGLPAAFHARFDAAVLRRAFAGTRGLRAPKRWLDLAELAPALHPGLGRSCHALDEWLGAFGIACPQRHDALADAFATAQLLLVLLGEGARQGLRTVEALTAAARHRKWLAPP